MVLEAVGSLHPRITKTKGTDYTRYYIYLPSDLVKDSQFPFNLEKRPVKITIDGERLLIEKTNDKK